MPFSPTVTQHALTFSNVNEFGFTHIRMRHWISRCQLRSADQVTISRHSWSCCTCIHILRCNQPSMSIRTPCVRHLRNLILTSRISRGLRRSWKTQPFFLVWNICGGISMLFQIWFVLLCHTRTWSRLVWYSSRNCSFGRAGCHSCAWFVSWFMRDWFELPSGLWEEGRKGIQVGHERRGAAQWALRSYGSMINGRKSWIRSFLLQVPCSIHLYPHAQPGCLSDSSVGFVMSQWLDAWVKPWIWGA